MATTKPEPLYVEYSTRKMRRNLRDLLRIEATMAGLTMEEALNVALDLGLRQMKARRTDAAAGSE